MMTRLFLRPKRLNFWPCFIFSTFWTALILIASSMFYKVDLQNEVESFLSPKSLKLGNILDDDESLGSDAFRKIFFVETHVDEVRILSDPRQVCSVESAARMNPDAKVYLILITNSTSVSLKYSELAEVLLSYDNIHIKFLNIYEFSKGTDVEHLIKSGLVFTSKFHLSHMSDVMRVLILSKYRGLYLDLDVFSMVPLSEIKYSNYACTQSDNIIAFGIVNIDEKGLKAIEFHLKKLNSSYDPNNWAANGPSMFTHSVGTFCKYTELKSDRVVECDEFTILPASKCYPIIYQDFHIFYKEDETQRALNIIEQSKPYFVHIWNKMQEFGNQHFQLTFNSNATYIHLAKKFCPRALKTVEKYF